MLLVLPSVEEWGECIFPVLYHACCQFQREILGMFLEVGEHIIFTPSLHHLNFVIVDARHEELHCASNAHGTRNELFKGEDDFWSCAM